MNPTEASQKKEAHDRNALASMQASPSSAYPPNKNLADRISRADGTLQLSMQHLHPEVVPGSSIQAGPSESLIYDPGMELEIFILAGFLQG